MCIIYPNKPLGVSAEEFLSQSSVQTGLVLYMLTWGFLCAVPDHTGGLVSEGCLRDAGVRRWWVANALEIDFLGSAISEVLDFHKNQQNQE